MPAPEFVEHWMHRTHERVRATKNILSPLQWVLGIISVPCTTLIIWGPADLRYVFVSMLVGMPALIVIFYSIFAFFAPDRLQSEEHRENMTILSQPYQDDRGIVIEANSANVAPPPIAAAEPAPPGLSPPSSQHFQERRHDD